MTSPWCCARCRLLQPRANGCAHCGGELLDLVVDWERVLVRDVVGVGAQAKPPPTGWRDALALAATIAGMIGGGVVGAMVGSELLGLGLSGAAVAVGYNKQFWRAVLKRKPRVAAVRAISPPDGVGTVGVAEPWQETIAAGGALVIQRAVWADDGLLFRRVDSVPFALVPRSGARGIVTGVCAIPLDRTRAQRIGDARVLAALHAELGLPDHLQLGPGLLVEHTVLHAGDQVKVIAEAGEEVVAGLGGYRDSSAPVWRGERNKPVWLTPP